MGVSKFRRLANSIGNAILTCLILGSICYGKSKDFYVRSEFLFKTSGKERSCSVVKIHSLYENPEGKLLSQEGVGWVTQVQNNLGVLTPYHVIVNAQWVFAECRGIFFELFLPQSDIEKDLSFLFFRESNHVKLLKDLMPFVFAPANEDKEYFRKTFNTETAKMLNIYLSRQELETKLFEIMASMSNFGVVSPPPAIAMERSLLLSPTGDDFVQGYVEAGMNPIKQLIRIENFGIKPGLSGSVLIGIPDNSRLTNVINVKEMRREFSVPVEFMPKAVLGMVIKTKLNGAETVAISITDIFDFIESRLINRKRPDRSLQIRYRTIKNGAQEVLQSYLVLNSPKGPVEIEEYCSQEYKNSADFKVLEVTKVLKALEQKRAKDSRPTITYPQFQYQTPMMIPPINQTLSPIPFKHLRKIPQSPHSPIKSETKGGGEYGEGGDGFRVAKSQFLTSETQIGDFREALDFPTLSKIPSFGLHLTRQFCGTRGLLLNGHLINTVKLDDKLIRLTSLEDFRRFHALYKEDSLPLLQEHGIMSQVPFFTEELKNLESLEMPLHTTNVATSENPNWKPGAYDFFKQRLISVLPTHKRASSLSISSNHLQLAVEMKTKAKQPPGHLTLNYKNQTWNGHLELGQSCELKFKPEYFRQINPWRVEYTDGKTYFYLDFSNRIKLLSINFKNINCPQFERLVMGEIEIYPYATLTPVIGTTREALYALPMNYKELLKLFAKSKAQESQHE